MHIELEELKKNDLIAYEGNGPYLLFGRELIQLFDIIFHGDKVSQGCKVLNDEVKLLEEYLETDEFEELQDAADSIRSDTESGRKVLYITGPTDQLQECVRPGEQSDLSIPVCSAEEGANGCYSENDSPSIDRGLVDLWAKVVSRFS